MRANLIFTFINYPVITLYPDVVSIGEPMAEFCATGIGRLGQVDLFKRGWGGDTSNFAVAVARLGGEVGYLCRIGDDEFGRSFMALWRREGVDISRVAVDPQASTAVYFISLTEDLEHDFTYYRAGSAASRYSRDDLDREYVRRARVLHSSGISLAVSQSLREAVFEAVDLCKTGGGLFSFDPNFRPKLWPINTARAVMEYAFRKADAVLSSIEDMHLLYGVRDRVKAVEKLRGLGASVVAIKLGGEGCYVTSDEGSLHVPGFRVEVVDTTGSGDAFDAAFVVGLLEGWDLNKTATFANAVGALTTTAYGAVAPLPNRERALNLMNMRESGG
ncbi:MAG: sugar kinase [Candidatus Bathyarchaeota archaeon]|nr:sugar kinase [Candidatus Bathyarchaeota archaeon]